MKTKTTRTPSGVRIYLGVDRQMYAGPSAWLGSGLFSTLAAAIGAPDTADSRYYLRWARRDGLKENEEALPSASLALAGRVHEAGIEEAPPLFGCVQKSQMRLGRAENGQSGHMNWALTDYSEHGALELETIAAVGPEVIAQNADRFRGRPVILGDYTRPSGSDNFIFYNGLIAGVLLHACGASTAQGEPLLELTHLGRLVFDLAISGMLVVMITLVRVACAVRWGRDVSDSERLFRWLVAGAIALTCVFSVSLIHLTRIMWTDFFVVILALVAHLIFHQPLGNLLGRAFPWFRHHQPPR